MKLVNSDYQVAGDDETVVSRVEYEEKLRERESLLETVKGLREKGKYLTKEFEKLEQGKISMEDEEKEKGKEVLHLIDDLKRKIMEGRLEIDSL